jgi:hypothetical protein
VVLQLDEVTLVDVDVVGFSNRCELEGVRLVDCSPYLREWMSRAQNRSEVCAFSSCFGNPDDWSTLSRSAREKASCDPTNRETKRLRRGPLSY